MDFNLDTLKSIGNKLLDVAPSLAGAVLAPNPLTVGLALKSIAKAIGLSPDAPEIEIDAALVANPEIRLKMMVAENDFKAEMSRQELEKFKAILTDVQSARAMNVETTKVTGKGDKIGQALDVLITIGFFSTLFCYMFMKIPTGQEGTVGLLVGALIGSFTTIIAFYRGSTKESGRKTDMIANSTPINGGK